MLLFVRILMWFTGIWFCISVGMLIYSFAADASLFSKLTWVILVPVFAVQCYDFRRKVKTELTQRENDRLREELWANRL